MAADSRYSIDFMSTFFIKLLSFSILTFFVLAILLSNSNPSCRTPSSPLVRLPSPQELSLTVSEQIFESSQKNLKTFSDLPRTTLNNIVFGLVGSTKTWRHRRHYIESWWRPNITKGYIFLDTPPTKDILPWSPLSPSLRVSDDTRKLFPGHIAPIAIRILHAVLEVFREARDHEEIRWFVMGDDDSIFIIDNWVDVLSKYDHNKYVYIGGHSESIRANVVHSFDMGFGGAGFALSYRLAKSVAQDLENCIRRYPLMYAADQILMTCVADFGVSANFEKGIHQIDLHGDISGLLSSHPQAPLLSLHHFDYEEPIFPSMDRANSAKHLMKAADADRLRLLQQTVCYHRPSNWTFSVSWGYSAHIYEKTIPRSVLRRPLETFKPWGVRGNRPPYYMFNTRPLSKNPCEVPHVFSFDSVVNKNSSDTEKNEIVTTYVRSSRRGLPTCVESDNKFGDQVLKIQVFSPTTKPPEEGKSECCDVLQVGDNDERMAKVQIRSCFEDEIA